MNHQPIITSKFPVSPFFIPSFQILRKMDMPEIQTISENSIPSFLALDRLWIKLKKLEREGNVDFNDILPLFNEGYNQKLELYLKRELEINGIEQFTLFQFINLIVEESKKLRIEIDNLVFNGWRAWQLLENWGYLAILNDVGNYNQIPAFSSPLEIIVSIKNLESLALLKNGLNYSLREKLCPESPWTVENLSNSFEDTSYLKGQKILSTFFKIKDGERVLLKIISSQEGEKFIFPAPIAISIKHFFYRKASQCTILCQNFLNCLVGAAEAIRSPCHVQDQWMLIVRNLVKGCRPITTDMKKLSIEVRDSFDASSSFLTQTIQMVQTSFEDQLPQTINELHAAAFQICLLLIDTDEERAVFWKRILEWSKKLHLDSNEVEVLKFVATLVIEEKIPFSLIVAFFDIMGYIHQHSEEGTKEENQPINFRLTKGEHGLGYRVSFLTQASEAVFIFIDLSSARPVSPLYALGNFDEAVQQKLFSLYSLMLPHHPIEQIRTLSTSPWLPKISYFNVEKEALIMLETKNPYIQFLGFGLLCTMQTGKDEFFSFPILLDYLPNVFKDSIPPFFLESLDQLLLKYSGSEKILQNMSNPFFENGKMEEKQLLFGIVTAFSKCKLPKILIPLKNRWIKCCYSLKRWDEEVVISAVQLFETLVEAFLISDALGVFDLLTRKKERNLSLQVTLLLKIYQYAKTGANTPEMVVCYSQLEKQAKRIIGENRDSKGIFPPAFDDLLKDFGLLEEKKKLEREMGFKTSSENVEHVLSKRNSLSQSELKLVFDFLIKQHQVLTSEFKRKILVKLTNYFAKVKFSKQGNELVSLFKTHYLFFLTELQRTELYTEIPTMLLKSDPKEEATVKQIALGSLEKLTTSNSNDCQIQAYNLLNWMERRASFFWNPPNQKIQIYCTLATHFFSIDPDKGKHLIFKLLKMEKEFWCNAPKEVIQKYFYICLSFLGSQDEVGKGLGKILRSISAEVTQTWLSIFQEFFEEKEYILCSKMLILARKQFHPRNEFPSLEAQAEKFLFSLTSNKTTKEIFKECLELFKLFPIKKGEIWLQVLSCGTIFNGRIRKDIFQLWKTAELNQTIIYADGEQKQCWEIALAHFSDFSYNDVIDILHQITILMKLFDEPTYCFIIVKETVRILIKENFAKLNSSLLMSLIKLRDVGAKDGNKNFWRDIDHPLLLLLISHGEDQSESLRIFEANIQKFSDSTLYPTFAAVFLCFLKHINIVQDDLKTHIKLLTLAPFLRKKLSGFLDYFGCAEELSKIHNDEAILESLAMVLDGLNQQTRARYSPNQVFSILSHCFDRLPKQVDQKLVVTCLNLSQIFFLKKSQVCDLWCKFISNLLKTDRISDVSYEDYILLSQFCLDHIEKTIFNLAQFQVCFKLIIQQNLRFLKKYQIYSGFHGLQTYAFLTLLPTKEKLQHTKTDDPLAELGETFIPLYVYVLQEYLRTIDEGLLKATNHIDSLYYFCYDVMEKKPNMVVSNLDVAKTALRAFCLWTPPATNDHLYEKHLSLVFSLSKEILKTTYAKEIIPEIFNYFFKYSSAYPESLGTLQTCYNQMKLFMKEVMDILPKSDLEGIILKLIMLAPLPFNYPITVGEDINEYPKDYKHWRNFNFEWLYEILQIAFDKKILSQSTSETLKLYLNEEVLSLYLIVNSASFDITTILNLFKIGVTYPSYFAAIRFVQILTIIQPCSSMADYKKCFDLVFELVQKLPNVNTPFFLSQIFYFSTALCHLIQKAPGYPPASALASFLLERITEVRMQIIKKNNGDEKLLLDKANSMISCLTEFCKKGFYNANWNSLLRSLEFMRSHLLALKHVPNCSLAPILCLLVDSYCLPLESPDHASRMKFFLDCFSDNLALNNSEENTEENQKTKKLIEAARCSLLNK